MEKVIITICKNRKVKKSREFIGVCGEEKLEELIVDFDNADDFIDGNATVEIEKNGEKASVPLEKVQEDKYYKTAIQGELVNCACTLKMQVKIPTDNKTFKSEIFNMICKESIN